MKTRLDVILETVSELLETYEPYRSPERFSNFEGQLERDKIAKRLRTARKKGRSSPTNLGVAMDVLLHHYKVLRRKGKTPRIAFADARGNMTDDMRAEREDVQREQERKKK